MWTIAGVRSVVTAPEGIDLVIVVVKTSIEDRVQLVAAGGMERFAAVCDTEAVGLT